MSSLERYLVELRRPEFGWHDLQALTQLARESAGTLQLEGIPVRCLRSIYVPEDGACFLLYEGPSAESVVRAAACADLGVLRVAPTMQADQATATDQTTTFHD